MIRRSRATPEGWTPHGALGEPLGGGSMAVPRFPTHLLAAIERQGLGAERLLLAWEIARFEQSFDPGRFRGTLLLALALLAAQEEGSTRLPLDPATLEPRLRELGAAGEDLRAVRDLLAALRSVGGLTGSVAFGAPGDYRPLLLDGDGLYSQRLLRLEERVAEALATRLRAPAEPPRGLAAALDDVTRRPSRSAAGSPELLSEEQQAAVAGMLSGGLGVVTGGPGTGKTSIVVTLLRVVARLDASLLGRIALAAPTGRAADRMHGSLRRALERVSDPAGADAALLAALPPAATLHRLLAYSPSGERFRRHQGNPLAEELVVVDESSMLDLDLTDRLLRALPPTGRLVLLGDAAQLPSVEAGALFRDLVAAAAEMAPARLARLTHSYRMDPGDPAGASILAVAEAVLAGRSPTAPEPGPPEEPARPPALPVRRRAAELTFRGPELLLATSGAEREELLARWFEERVAALPRWRERAFGDYQAVDGGFTGTAAEEIEALLAHYERFRILCATRYFGGGTGAGAVNAWLRARIARIGPGTGDPRSGVAGPPLPGEPVLVAANDYRRGLFNGDQGVVLNVATGPGAAPRPCAVLRPSGVLVALPLSALEGRLVPAWATTVHKAQGSELDYAALILPVTATRALTRELVYTALTRARRAVVVVGSPERLQEAVERRADRHCGVAERIQAAPLR
jgi:exodeoxyribonuclease V alpha subunit